MTVVHFDRSQFFAELNMRFAELRSDRESWAEIRAERELEAGCLGDASDVGGP